MANLMVIKGSPPPKKKTKRQTVFLYENGKAAQIIKFLMENGPSTGSELRDEIGLKSGAKAYIQPHVKAQRVLISKEGVNRGIYKINPLFNTDLFVFGAKKYTPDSRESFRI